jgi:hypothetical protein
VKPDGHYEFLRLPFGLKNVTFSHFSKIILHKCTWFSQEVSLLGHIVKTSGIHLDPKKVHAIQAMLPLTNVKQVKQFLGIYNDNRKFIAYFAKISQSIAELVKKEIPFIWSVACN